jgi:HSP20 family protein
MNEEKVSEKKQEGTLTVDVYFKDDNLVIVAPIAGASLDNIEILVDGDVLIIKGERMPPENIDPSLYEHQECFWGPFSRTIILPKDLDLESIRAHYHNGILMVKIPKKGEREVKRVEIKVE